MRLKGTLCRVICHHVRLVELEWQSRSPRFSAWAWCGQWVRPSLARRCVQVQLCLQFVFGEFRSLLQSTVQRKSCPSVLPYEQLGLGNRSWELVAGLWPVIGIDFRSSGASCPPDPPGRGRLKRGGGLREPRRV